MHAGFNTQPARSEAGPAHRSHCAHQPAVLARTSGGGPRGLLRHTEWQGTSTLSLWHATDSSDDASHCYRSAVRCQWARGQPEPGPEVLTSTLGTHLGKVPSTNGPPFPFKGPFGNTTSRYGVPRLGSPARQRTTHGRTQRPHTKWGGGCGRTLNGHL